MKLKKLNFREIDRKFIIIDDTSNIKKINKKLKTKFDNNPVLGYIYINHEDGMCIRILGNIFKENGKYFFQDTFIYDKVLVINLSNNTNYNITILSDKVTNNIGNTKELIEDIDKYYIKNGIIASRNMNVLDDFRHKYYPDDIELYNKSEDDEEIIWGRIEDSAPDKNVVVCKLLDDSKIFDKYKENSLVIAQYVENSKEKQIEIKSSVKRKEE